MTYKADHDPYEGQRSRPPPMAADTGLDRADRLAIGAWGIMFGGMLARLIRDVP